MKLAKKACLGLLVACTAVSAVGCGSKEEVSTDTKTEAKKEDGDKKKDTTDVAELDMFYYDGTRVFKDSLPVWEALAEKANVSLNAVNMLALGGNADEEFDKMINGDLPDIIHGSIANLGNNADKLADLDELIAEHAPSLAKYLDENPIIKAKSTGPNGKLKYIPYMPDGKVSEVFYIRKDWLDNLGLDVPKNTDEYWDALKAIVEGDANGNGIKDEVGYFDRDENNGFRGLYNLYDLTVNSYVDGDTVKNDLLQRKDEFKAATKEIAAKYAEGLIDAEIFTRGKESREYMFDRNIGASTIDWATSTGGYQSRYADKIEGLKWSPMLTPINTAGNHWTDYSRQGISDWAWSISADSDNLVEAIGLFETMFTPEGNDIANFGPEGVTFEYVDGKPQLKKEVIENMDKSVIDQMHEVGAQSQAGYKQNFEYEKQWMNEDILEAIDMYEEADIFKPTIYSLGIPFNSDVQTKKNDIDAKIRDNVNNYLKPMITGQMDIDAEFDNFYDALIVSGIEELLEIEQEAYTATLN